MKFLHRGVGHRGKIINFRFWPRQSIEEANYEPTDAMHVNFFPQKSIKLFQEPIPG